MALLRIKLELIKFWAIETWKELSSLKKWDDYGGRKKKSFDIVKDRPSFLIEDWQVLQIIRWFYI